MRLRRAQAIDGWMTDVELKWLARHARGTQIIVEIGSWFGRSTRVLTDNSSALVICIDTWAGPKGYYAQQLTAKLGGQKAIFKQFKRNMRPYIADGRVVPIVAHSAYAMAALEQHLGGEKVDLLFIDGDHSYSAVKRDILNYKRFVRKGGILCGCDINTKKVRRAVVEVFDRRYHAAEFPGVKQTRKWKELPTTIESGQRIWWVNL